MRSILILTFLLNSSFCFGQNNNKITKIEVYGQIIDYSYSSPPPNRLVRKSDIKKKATIYVSIIDEMSIEMSKLQDHISNLIVAEDKGDAGDYIALTIIHYSNKKKEKYYITRSDAGIYKGNIRHEYSCAFVAAVYSFLPIYYYDYDYEFGSPNYYQKPCDKE